MNDTYELRSGETHIEVHKFYPGAIVVVGVAALVFQAMAPVYFPKLSILDLPLLVTVYFGLSRRNPSTGLLLGMIAKSSTSVWIRIDRQLICTTSPSSLSLI